MSTSVLGTGFRYDCSILLPDGELIEFTDFNILPQSGVDHIAGLLRGDGTSPISSWYVGIFEGNFVPVPGTTSADLPAIECTAYSGSNRPVWTNSYDGVSVIDNLNSKAVFNMTAPKTIYGAFIVSNSTKAGNVGTLLSIARFSSPKVLDSGTQFGVTAGITLIPTT